MTRSMPWKYAGSSKLFSVKPETHTPENKRILFLLIDILLKQDKYQEAMKLVERQWFTWAWMRGFLPPHWKSEGK